jgi:hypothetical protein
MIKHSTFSMRKLLAAIALVGLLLGGIDALSTKIKSNKYLKKAEASAKMENKCRMIDSMDPATRTREAAAAYDNPYLDNPEWNKKMIVYFQKLKEKYYYAADHPRLPVSPDEPAP